MSMDGLRYDVKVIFDRMQMALMTQNKYIREYQAANLPTQQMSVSDDLKVFHDETENIGKLANSLCTDSSNLATALIRQQVWLALQTSSSCQRRLTSHCHFVTFWCCTKQSDFIL